MDITHRENLWFEKKTGRSRCVFWGSFHTEQGAEGELSWKNTLQQLVLKSKNISLKQSLNKLPEEIQMKLK